MAKLCCKEKFRFSTESERETETKSECSDHICTQKADVDSINNKFLGEHTHSYNATIARDFKSSNAPCPEILKLRKDARVMVLVNSANEGVKFCNGTLGVVEDMNDEKIKVRLDTGQSVWFE